MVEYSLSRAELEAHLAEQLGFLQRSAHAFDEGYVGEAKRIAIALRILLHTRRYPSLLKQLGQDEIPFVDTRSLPTPGNLLKITHNLISISMDKSGVRYAAKLDLGSSRMTPFAEWWSAVVFVDKDGNELTRADIVLSAADQDGGAHVDAALRADYAAISRQNSLGWCTGDAAGKSRPLKMAELVALRQIAHEALKTLIPTYDRTKDDVAKSVRLPEVSDGKMRFYPSGEHFLQTKPTSPIVVGSVVRIQMLIDSISVGSVRMVIGGLRSDKATTPGLFEQNVIAGDGGQLGVLGSFTDAVLGGVSARLISNG